MPRKDRFVLTCIALAVPFVAFGVEAQERIRDFVFTRATDQMSGADRSTLMTKELTPTLLRTAALYWRCDGDRLNLFVFLDDFLNSSNDPALVQWRFDNDTASPFVSWAVSTEGTAAFAPDDLIPLLTSRAKGASRVGFRLVDYRRTPHDVTFRLLGFTAGLGRLRCARAIDVPIALDTTRRVLHVYGSSPAGIIPVLTWECQESQFAVSLRLYGRLTWKENERVAMEFDAKGTPSDWWEGWGHLEWHLKPAHVPNVNERVSTATSLEIQVADYFVIADSVERYDFPTANLGSSLSRLTCP